jgi:hypothetical protein
MQVVALASAARNARALATTEEKHIQRLVSQVSYTTVKAEF